MTTALKAERDRAANWFRDLRDQIVAAFETLLNYINSPDNTNFDFVLVANQKNTILNKLENIHEQFGISK